MRRIVVLSPLVVAFVFAAAAGPAEAPSLAPAEAAPQTCSSTYTQQHFRRAARATFRSTTTVTTREKRTLRRMVRCARRTPSRSAMRVVLKRWKAWRSSDAGYWRLASERLTPATHQGLRRLRGCETRGRPFPSNYRSSDGYHGAYQYDQRTWHEAGGSGLAYQASPDEQDVRTARFYPGHEGRWPNCSM